MSRTTIDFGIDLGTTNSAIAVINGTTTDIIKNNADNQITPSAVYINKHGQVQVGLRAKQRLNDEKSIPDAHIEFKRRMASSHIYTFKSAGLSMSPEQLSAEVLKSLRGDVQQRTGEIVQSAVITVPAAFEQKQCISTKQAGALAGLIHCPLVQEPVAAALAYGYQSDVTKEYWLVYDFGGGTFDAALLKAEDGTINVVNHGGDNYLGGKDIDLGIIEKLFIPELINNYNLPEFNPANPIWENTFIRIKSAVESAKIELSRSDTTFFECPDFMDADGEHIELDIKLTRDAIVGVAEPLISRSVNICKRVLAEKNLSPSAVENMLLVGGPTLAPYFRQMLNDQMGIEVNSSIDPLTVVSRGAAVFAGTQPVTGVSLPKIEVGQYKVDLKYNPVGADEDPSVRGTVESEDGSEVDEFVIEFVNEKTQWRSGRIPLRNEGRFRLNLLAEKGYKNIFKIELYDGQGNLQEVIPSELSYTIGMAISEQPVINSIGLALANNGVDFFFKKGDALPAKATNIYRTVHAVKKGESGDVLKIPVVEGESEKADRNRLQDSLMIKAHEIKRDLPVGSEIEVTLIIDADRIITAKAFVPVLDEEFKATIEPDKRETNPDDLKKDLKQEQRRIKELRSKADSTDELDTVDDQLDELADLVDSSEQDPDTAKKAEARLLEVKMALDKAENSSQWPTLVENANAALVDLDGIVDTHGNDEHARKASQLHAEVEEIIEQNNPERLRKKTEQVHDLYNEVLFEQPAFWVQFFSSLEERRSDMQDQTMASRLFEQGRQNVQNGNIPGLRSVVSQLMQLLPKEVSEEMQQGYGSGIIA